MALCIRTQHTHDKSLIMQNGHDHFQHINHHCIRRNAPLPHGRDALLSLACLPRRAPRCALARPAGSAARATAGCTYIRVAKGAARTSSLSCFADLAEHAHRTRPVYSFAQTLWTVVLDPDCIGGICNASPSRLEVSGDLAAGLVSNNNTIFLVRLDTGS